VKLNKVWGVVGSRKFTEYGQVKTVLDRVLSDGDEIVSGGAIGVDSMAQRYAKETGRIITIIYPNYARFGRGATFTRNREIVEHADEVVAFYSRNRFREGGTANTAEWCRKLNIPLHEFEEGVSPLETLLKEMDEEFGPVPDKIKEEVNNLDWPK
jgi:predicted Rossmann fold nucleotide-binding protein DprA/Smf involved in DNA uptake